MTKTILFLTALIAVGIVFGVKPNVTSVTNFAEAVALTRKTADAGHAPVQCKKVFFYMSGLGVDRDEDKAVEWLKKAAAQNHVQAQYNLGIHCAKFSDKKACQQTVKWFNEAVKQGYADVQDHAGAREKFEERGNYFGTIARGVPLAKYRWGFPFSAFADVRNGKPTIGKRNTSFSPVE